MDVGRSTNDRVVDELLGSHVSSGTFRGTDASGVLASPRARFAHKADRGALDCLALIANCELDPDLCERDREQIIEVFWR